MARHKQKSKSPFTSQFSEKELQELGEKRDWRLLGQIASHNMSKDTQKLARAQFQKADEGDLRRLAEAGDSDAIGFLAQFAPAGIARMANEWRFSQGLSTLGRFVE